MDFDERKEQIRRMWAQRVKGDSLAEVWANQRKCSWKNPEFWKVFTYTLRKLVSTSFGAKLSLTTTFACIVRQIRSGVIQRIFASLAALASMVEALNKKLYESPPKGFVPLPDAEIGGCVRNDNLTAPLVN